MSHSRESVALDPCSITWNILDYFSLMVQVYLSSKAYNFGLCFDVCSCVPHIEEDHFVNEVILFQATEEGSRRFWK